MPESGTLGLASDASVAAIRRIADALERIAARLDVLVPLSVVPTSSSGDDLVSMDELCARLGTSKRWVQRHIKPTARASARGRAWYRLSDVEAQIALGPAVVDRGNKKRARGVPTVARDMSASSSAPEVLDVERRLRMSVSSQRKRTT